MFTTEHFIWIGLCAAFVAGMSVISVKRNFSLRRAGMIMTVLCAFSEVSKVLGGMLESPGGGMHLDPLNLPLHLCSLMLFAVLYLTFGKEGRFRQLLANFLAIDLNGIGINLRIPTGSLLVFALLALAMWAFLHTKTGTAMTAVGSNPAFAKAAGINVDKMRLISVIMSTWLGAVGILMYEQGFGFVQLYMGPFWMALPAVSAILIGGASVNKASIPNVIIGTFLFQGIVTMTPTVMNSAFHMDMSEVIRIIVSNGMILYALTRKTEGSK